MKAASLKQIKDELRHCSRDDLLNICIRLVKFRVENKELLTYLLFSSVDESAYIRQVREMMDEEFAVINRRTVYYIKKTIRKILKQTRRYIKYSGEKTTELDLLIYFCRKMRTEKIPMDNSRMLANIFQRELGRIEMLLAKMHEDIRADYEEDIVWLKA